MDDDNKTPDAEEVEKAISQALWGEYKSKMDWAERTSWFVFATLLIFIASFTITSLLFWVVGI